MLNTFIAGLLSLLIVFILLQVMEKLEPVFPVLEQNWVGKVVFVAFPIVWVGLGYLIYSFLN